MAFLQDIGKKISNVAQDASRKTGDMIEVGKLNASISADKKAIDELYKKIGAAVFSMDIAGEPLPSSLSGDLQAVRDHLADITRLEQKIAEIKTDEDNGKPEATGTAASASTGTPVASPSSPAAPGTPESERAPEVLPAAAAPAKVTRFCTACGAVLDPAVHFCGSCGQKV